jgi:adenosylcobyric acid synthase
VLARIDRPEINANTLAEKLMASGIAIRVCDNFQGLDERFFRLAVRTEDENQRLVDGLKQAFGAPVQKRKAKTSAIMFQGISSNAGKSVLTAAMCRILLQDGYKVAPFKAQNMSLNSFVTRDGGEMGRAQVTQAQAAKLDPDVRMNPILLKPNSDTGSQVIVCGRPVGNMDVNQYIRYKPEAFEAVKEAYDSLASEYDVIVLEGAGSPAEVNLKHHDIVNMNMARYAKAPALLVGDIDRGGVFASFVGTMEVLAEWERALVAGFVINKFRGNVDLLADAIDFTRRHTGKPTFGVVPYFHDLGLPEEDSVSFKSGILEEKEILEDSVEIAVIDLPHISNFTDFDAFRLEPDVKLKIVRSPQDLNRPDAIILPGTKNTIGDLEYLKSRGLADPIKGRLCENGAEVVGICGGFQMIGAGIADPHKLETDGKTIEGLGFLNVVTVLAKEKTLTRFSGRHIESGLPVYGYEIHHGLSENAALKPVSTNSAGGFDGATSAQGAVWGTYVHGIFDSDEFRRWFIDKLRVRRGLAPKGRVMSVYNIEAALDRLADTVRKSMDIKRIYRLLGL